MESAAELYVTDHKNSIKTNTCSITFDKLIQGNYIDEEAIKDSNGNDFSGCIKYTKGTTSLTFEYSTSDCSNACVGIE